ncbi:calcineurin B 7 isoform X1 [Chlorella sorokiniana]|jgi:serine/threonine-protein phosphatase 2B regulatory subunit|uniref:Calcineurin B 7 isoform X1 n=1 Tax=Chlorella sorokiniana TaxID=3076 RepID=A0A2P6TPL0_CHLSO|nr:calcineurin B 7 isoform X1 [Chlorella sorokiniana]|eukprot:PRW55970.1 calcineurin B 7 isoform X1 [Chlorella sorokiniana]
MGCAHSAPAVAEPPPSGANSGLRKVQDAPTPADPDSPEALARDTYFTRDEVLALRELYTKLSNELHQDNLIHKDEFMWALFKANKDNLFAERVFTLFDIKHNQVIEFGEFVRSLSVFHPNAPLVEKAKFAFRIYDIDATGRIERPELKRFLVALMADNPDVDLDEVALDDIVDQTFTEMDLTKDGVINPEEWLALVQRNPDVISFMTLPVLTEVCKRWPTPKKGAAPQQQQQRRVWEQ